MDSHVLDTAYSARRLFESGHVYDQNLITLYEQYNPLQNPDLFFSQAKDLFPNLNCGIASVYLKHRLGKGVIVQGQFQNHGHTFLLLDEDMVLDITADQFGGPAIYFGPLSLPWAVHHGKLLRAKLNCREGIGISTLGLRRLICR